MVPDSAICIQAVLKSPCCAHGFRALLLRVLTFLTGRSLSTAWVTVFVENLVFYILGGGGGGFEDSTKTGKVR